MERIPPDDESGCLHPDHRRPRGEDRHSTAEQACCRQPLHPPLTRAGPRAEAHRVHGKDTDPYRRPLCRSLRHQRHDRQGSLQGRELPLDLSHGQYRPLHHHRPLLDLHLPPLIGWRRWRCRRWYLQYQQEQGSAVREGEHLGDLQRCSWSTRSEGRDRGDRPLPQESR